MRRLKQYVALVLLVLWIPATMHCLLENINIPALDFLACCLHADHVPHQDDDCDSDECAVVETGHYMVEDHSDLTACPPLFALCFFTSLLETELTSASASIHCQGVSPPELNVSWQFAERAAIPVRAPSLIS